jgi:L-seryl-tRNA(Ser) seleniumtransferase
MQRPEQSVVDGSKASPKDLPSIDRLLRAAACPRSWPSTATRSWRQQARALLEGRAGRRWKAACPPPRPPRPPWRRRSVQRIEARLAPRMRRVFNLTGTVIHTNLGRALLAEPALQHVLAMMGGPNNLEYDLDSGSRGDRDSVVEELLCTLTGAQAATVVNNNAAAVLLTIAALARGARSSSRAASWWRSAAPSACPM